MRASSSAITMLREPPLVEMPMATSSGLACAMSWRRKITSVPTSLASAVMLAGSMEREIAGIGAVPGRRKHAIHGPVVGVGCRAAVAEEDQLAAARQALVNGQSGSAELLSLFIGKARAQQGVVVHLHLNRSSHVVYDSQGFLLLLTEEGIEEFRLSHILAQFAVFQEDVHRLP